MSLVARVCSSLGLALAAAAAASSEAASCEAEEGGDDGDAASSLLQTRSSGSEARAGGGTSGTLSSEAEAEASTGAQTRWFEPEHKLAGDSLRLSNGINGSDLFTLPTHGHRLTYGDIVLACGDWYGKADGDISGAKTLPQRKRRFLDGPWGCLDSDRQNPSRVMQYAEQYGLGWTPPPGCDSVLGLAVKNYDHFAMFQRYSFEEQGGGGAWEAYSAGHAAACDTAAGSRSQAALNEALMQNACASHFLTDLFSSGHLRQPRRAFQGVADGLISKEFHDEDCAYGLWVSNAQGDKWKAYGDACWESWGNRENRKYTVRAATASAEAVLQAWTSGSTAACQADAQTARLLPNLTEAQDLDSQRRLGNHPPLLLPATGMGFALGSGKITGTLIRNDYCDMSNYTKYVWYNTELAEFFLRAQCPVAIRGRPHRADGKEPCADLNAWKELLPAS